MVTTWGVTPVTDAYHDQLWGMKYSTGNQFCEKNLLKEVLCFHVPRHGVGMPPPLKDAYPHTTQHFQQKNDRFSFGVGNNVHCYLLIPSLTWSQNWASHTTTVWVNWLEITVGKHFSGSHICKRIPVYNTNKQTTVWPQPLCTSPGDRQPRWTLSKNERHSGLAAIHILSFVDDRKSLDDMSRRNKTQCLSWVWFIYLIAYTIYNVNPTQNWHRYLARALSP